jgi:hypothetical protein
MYNLKSPISRAINVKRFKHRAKYFAINILQLNMNHYMSLLQTIWFWSMTKLRIRQASKSHATTIIFKNMVKHACLVEEWFAFDGHVFWLWSNFCILGPLHKCDIIPLVLHLWSRLGKTKKGESTVTSKHSFTQTYSTQMCEIARGKTLTLQSGFSLKVN